MANKKMIHLELDIYPPYNSLGTFVFMGSDPSKETKGMYVTSNSIILKGDSKITINDRGAFEVKRLPRPKATKPVKEDTDNE